MFCVDEVCFTEASKFTEHLRTFHDESLLEEDIPSVVEMSCHRKMNVPDVCPVCPCVKSTSDEELTWIDHICKCLHDFSQRSLPWNDHAYSGRTTIAKELFLPDNCPLYRCGKTEFGDDLFYHRLQITDLEPANLDKESHGDSVQSEEGRHSRINTWHMTGPMGTLEDASTSPNNPPPRDESKYACPDHVATRPETPTREPDRIACPSSDTDASDDESSDYQWEELSDDKYFDDHSTMASSVLGSRMLSRDEMRSLKHGLLESAKLLLELKTELTTAAKVKEGWSEDDRIPEKSSGREAIYSKVSANDSARQHFESFRQDPTRHSAETLPGDPAKGIGNETPELNVRHPNKEDSDRVLTLTLDLVSEISSSLHTLYKALDARSAERKASWTSALYLLIVDLESAQIMQSATSEIPPCYIRPENPLHLLRLSITRYAPDVNSLIYIDYIHNQLAAFNELIEVALEEDWR
jgi:hypothetical protein